MKRFLYFSEILYREWFETKPTFTLEWSEQNIIWITSSFKKICEKSLIVRKWAFLKLSGKCPASYTRKTGMQLSATTSRDILQSRGSLALHLYRLSTMPAVVLTSEDLLKKGLIAIVTHKTSAKPLRSAFWLYKKVQTARLWVFQSVSRSWLQKCLLCIWKTTLLWGGGPAS